jgi:RNA polymerase sigma-70 factor, ECF subfamily
VLELSQPRVPCYKLGIRMGVPRFPRRFARAARPGAYLRIVDEGEIGAGDATRIVSRPAHGLTVGLVERAYHAERSLVAWLLDAPQLPESWAEWARRELLLQGRRRGVAPAPRRRQRNMTAPTSATLSVPMPDVEGAAGAGPAAGGDPELDPESRDWLAGLHSEGPDYDRAVAALHTLLLGAARHEAQRRRGSLPARVVDDLDDLARQAAGDAAAAVMRKLDTYRGASRFTTWAFKFAILEVSATLRRERWRGRPVTLDDAQWDRLPDPHPASAQARAEARELLGAIGRAIAEDLTPRQRAIFTAVVIQEVPIDVLAERLASTRGAIYKTLHDARRKLRTQLAAQGWSVPVEAGGAA